MNYWIIAKTKPNRERAVAVHLHQRALAVYLPLVWVNPTNPRAPRERPYFPAHLFVRADTERDWLEGVRWAPGLREVLTCDGEALRVSDAFIAELKERLGQVRAIAGLLPEDRPRGTAPLIGAGPFAGYEGIFDPRLEAAMRSHILLACVQQEHWRLKGPASSANGQRRAPQPK